MPTWHPHTLVSFGGVLNTAAPDHEIWQCGIRVMKPGNPGAPLDDHDAYLAAIATPLGAWFNGITNGVFPASTTLAWLKANPIGSDGKYSDDVTHLHDYSPVVTGHGSGGSSNPDILCLAISWTTDHAIRKHAYATHGRIYPPNYGSEGGTTGSMRQAGSTAASWAASGKALLTLLASSSVPAVPVIASGHNGEYLHITGVRVGDVLDVQRRRKDALKENYSALTYSSG